MRMVKAFRQANLEASDTAGMDDGALLNEVLSGGDAGPVGGGDAVLRSMGITGESDHIQGSS